MVDSFGGEGNGLLASGSFIAAFAGMPGAPAEVMVVPVPEDEPDASVESAVASELDEGSAASWCVTSGMGLIVCVTGNSWGCTIGVGIGGGGIGTCTGVCICI